MAEDRQSNRVWLCSVLFTDLVNYSSQWVETQINWKNFFNAALAEALKVVPPDDRVILDTGDGAALCFLGDPECAILCGLAILNAFTRRESEADRLPEIRLGIHLGPVKLVPDINGSLNAIGDGINVGQRIMSFAEGNQLLVSRGYFEVVSRLSDEYSRLFRYEGTRQDKHKREHAIYALVAQNPTSTPTVTNTPSAPAVTARDATKPEAAEAKPSTPPVNLDPAALKAIEECLAQLIGPVARHIVKTAARKASSITELYDTIAAAEVPAAERPVFLASCRKKLAVNGFTEKAHELVNPAPVSSI